MTEFVETVGLRCPARLMFEVTTIKKYMTDMYDVPLAAATVSDTAVYCSVFARCPLGAEGPRWSSGRGRQVQFPGVATGKANAATNEAGTAAKIQKKGKKRRNQDTLNFKDLQMPLTLPQKCGLHTFQILPVASRGLARSK